MSKTVSASEAKNRFGSIIGSVTKSGEEVIVESRGKPTVAIVSMADYEGLRALKEKKRRAKALESLRQLRAESLAANADLTPEEGDELAERFSREVITDMIREGKLRYEG